MYICGTNNYRLTLILLMWRKYWAPNSIPIYIQKDATLHSLFISGNCSTCFGWYFHPSLGTHMTVFTASGICHTVTAICRYRGRVGTGLSVPWVAYATHSTLKPVPTLPLCYSFFSVMQIIPVPIHTLYYKFNFFSTILLQLFSQYYCTLTTFQAIGIFFSFFNSPTPRKW